MTCECGKPRARKGTGCNDCNLLDAQRIERDSIRRRLLVRLRQIGDWTLAVDLRAAMELSDDESGALSAELVRLSRAGEIESQRIKGGIVYRLPQRRAA